MDQQLKMNKIMEIDVDAIYESPEKLADPAFI